MESNNDLTPEIPNQFLGIVSALNSSSRNDLIFLTIIAAICFYDTSHGQFTNSRTVFEEQKIFLSVLKKLILSQVNLFSVREDGHDGDVKKICGDNQCSCSSSSHSYCSKLITGELQVNIFHRLQLLQKAYEAAVLNANPVERNELIITEIMGQI